MSIEPAESAPSDTQAAPRTVNIGTRSSLLALIQADEVEKALKQKWPTLQYAVHSMKTLGDRDKVTPLPSFNAKSLWTKDLEVLLLDGKLDMIVHCTKDMPTQLPPGLTIASMPPRHDPRDVLIVSPRLSSTHRTLSSLPADSTIGTSSVRRTAQLRRLYPHLRFADARGNIDTRLSKLDASDSPYAALILAAAGIERIGKKDRITAYLSKDEGGMLYAVGQGALAVEIREGDERTRELVEGICDERTYRECLAERSLMRTLEGGCSVPIGVETEWVGGEEELCMRAIVVSLEGDKAVEAEMTKRIRSRNDADELGWELAAVLVEKGAEEILKEIILNRRIVEQQGDA
ncbi:MAG: porphobilinogen deaminase [Bogoriella megaspora]|nr:MAG: porphobilinogen deaminase [Bogoriella megaspora]